MFPSGSVGPEFFNDENLKRISEVSKNFVQAHVATVPTGQRVWFVTPDKDNMNKLDQVRDKFGIEGIMLERDGNQKDLLIEFILKPKRHKLPKTGQQSAFIIQLDENQPRAISPSFHAAMVDRRDNESLVLLSFKFPFSLDQLRGNFILVFNQGLLSNSADKATLLPMKFKLAQSSPSAI